MTPAPPPPKLTARIRAALVECFGRDELRMLTTDHFDVKLEWVTADRSFETVVFELIEWGERSGQLLHLLTAAAARVPNKPALAALRDECAAGSARRTSDQAAVRDATIRFNERFADWQKWLAVLRVNKGLHDILHQLQEEQPELQRLTAAAAAPGYDPEDGADLADALHKWVRQADTYAPPAALDRRRKWVTAFGKAVRSVAARLNGEPPPADLDRSLALLAHLPADQQPELNERLLETAENLDTAALNDLLARLQTALDPADVAALLNRFVAFQSLGGAMKRLTEQHRLAQLVDGALREADGLDDPTAATLAQWEDAAGWLARLAEARPADPAAARVLQTAGRFAAAPADSSDLLGALRTRFGRLFFEIDAELLAATDGVLRAAEVLDALLRRFML